ncbi:MAG: sensor histidine kinase, partial [Gemmatimonadetes bacterium]|nr:sensor histidine kinase [Gemmatimonadota bacterium]NIT87750.1 sensor histidine kinase [Gemmatimonadota bacterium]NIW64689.1 sensor histidine kinase [Gemmatimonadota bacterium]NIX40016.1 sensor histidine kinase [Gemmatimonadota bacterium]
RRRVARELHDNAQSLVLLSRMLAEVNDDPEVPASIGERVEALQELARGMLEEMRRTSRDLRPPVLDDLGLLAALEWVVGRHASFGGLDVAFVVEGPPRRLDPQTELAAFRIAQEALANAEKHADAEEVEVRARFDELGLLLEISDDGRGFDVSTPPSGFGLTGMRERARLVDASFSVTSGPDGTV